MSEGKEMRLFVLLKRYSWETWWTFSGDEEVLLRRPANEWVWDFVCFADWSSLSLLIMQRLVEVDFVALSTEYDRVTVRRRDLEEMTGQLCSGEFLAQIRQVDGVNGSLLNWFRFLVLIQEYFVLIDLSNNTRDWWIRRIHDKGSGRAGLNWIEFLLLEIKTFFVLLHLLL